MTENIITINEDGILFISDEDGDEIRLGNVVDGSCFVEVISDPAEIGTLLYKNGAIELINFLKNKFEL